MTLLQESAEMIVGTKWCSLQSSINIEYLFLHIFATSITRGARARRQIRVVRDSQQLGDLNCRDQLLGPARDTPEQHKIIDDHRNLCGGLRPMPGEFPSSGGCM